jgi:hypothetical protein
VELACHPKPGTQGVKVLLPSSAKATEGRRPEDTILRSEPLAQFREGVVFLFGLSKMAAGECMAGTAFQVTLEMLRLVECFKRNIDFQFPGSQLRGVIASAGVMVGHPLFQVGRMANVTFSRMIKAFNDIGVIHRLNCGDGLPSIARNSGRESPPSPRLRRTPSFARNRWRSSERRMVEPTGLEPATFSLRTRRSTN